MPPLRLLQPTREEAARLAAVERAAFAGDKTPWRPEDYCAAGSRGALIVADQAVAAGLAVLTLAADEADVVMLGVVPAARRLGLGARLLAHAEAVAAGRGVRRIVLEVARDNAAARRLYGTGGYAEVGRRRAYYLRPDGGRQDALILVKTLADPLAGTLADPLASPFPAPGSEDQNH